MSVAIPHNVLQKASHSSKNNIYHPKIKKTTQKQYKMGSYIHTYII